MQLKVRAAREELFQADDFAPDWIEHQRLRMDRIMQIRSEQMGVPVANLRFGYRDKQKLELVGRDGVMRRYRPSGIVTAIIPPAGRDTLYEFDVSWVDVWGYAHCTTRSFLEIQLDPIDELSFLRRAREYRDAKLKHWVTQKS